LTTAIPGPERGEVAHDLINDIKSMVGLTSVGFNFKLFAGSLFLLAGVFTVFVGIGIVANGLDLGRSFIHYDIGFYYVYTGLVMMIGGRVLRFDTD
jgi:hypothetical protein